MLSDGIRTVAVASHPFVTGAVLDPQLKRIAEYVHVCALAGAAGPQQPPPDDVAEADHPPAKPKRQTGESTRSATLQLLQRGATKDDSASANDFCHYLSAPVDSASAVNVVQRWRENEGAYPAMAAFAHRYLSVPATSV